MHRICTWIWACASLLSSGVHAQSYSEVDNLLVDGSFELKRWCPSGYNQRELKTLEHWRQPTDGTSDHFAACAGSGSAAGVPRNVFGEAPPVDGEAYAGVVLHSASKPSYREYLTTKMTRDLVAGEWVCVSWWVMAADGGRLVTDRMGAALTEKVPKGKGEGLLKDISPAVDNPPLHMLSDRYSWILLSDAYQARGGERWLTLGSFAGPEETRVLERADATGETSMWSYVYVDAAEVRPVHSPEECTCLNRTYAAEATDPPWQVFLKERVTLSSVLFAFDSSALDADAIAQLDQIAHTMRTNRFIVMEVNGHTDIVGPDGYNLALSERRARAVMVHLARAGVDPNRLKLSYHGSRLPTADNATADGRRQNRRVEFELLEHAFLPVN